VLLEVHFPAFVGIGQFSPHILALEKQANRLRTREMLCIPQQLVERRAGARCYDIERQWFDAFHASISNF